MPDFELTGPDGSKFQVTAPDESSALSAFQQFSGGAAPAGKEPVSADNVVRSAARGVPIVGGLADKLEAGLETALSYPVEPVMRAVGAEREGNMLSDEGLSPAARFAKALELQKTKDKNFDAEHPVVSTAAKIGGGVASFGGALKAVPALAGPLGVEGTLPAMITKGALSGAGIGAADAVARGESPVKAAEEGAIFGAMGGPIGKVIGKGAGMVASAFRKPVPLTHANTTNVAGVDVPVPNVDPVAASKIEIARRGAAGEPAQRVIQAGDEGVQAALERAKGNIGDMVNPNGSGLPPTPQSAAEQVASELRAGEQTRFQTEQATRQRVEADLQGLRSDLAPRPAAGAPPAPVVASPGAAAEIVGSGVEGRAQAARRAYKADYDAAAAMPSEFEPGTFRPIGDTVRARLNEGNSPVQPDSVTTPNSMKMLSDIDKNVGLGNFENGAALPPGVVSRETGIPSAAAAKTDAELAYEKLVGAGVAPEKARASVSALPGADRLPGGSSAEAVIPAGGPPESALAPHDVAVPGGGAVSVAPKVVEASSLRTSADKGYDPALQPRNRARAASDGQINDIAANLNPKRLGASAEADRGAPIVGPDGMVESGNGRTLAIRKAYAEGGPAADRYRAWLGEQGVDVSKFKEPVLVRERTTPMTPAERQKFTVAANQSSNLSMSATERALADSRNITPDSLSLIKNPADLGAVENRDFVRSFVSKLPQAEQGAMVTASGDLSAEGLARVRNAVIGKAYGDSPVLARMTESTNDEVRSLSNALTAAAPEWAALRAAIADGRVPADLDATAHLIDAVQRTAGIRGKGVSLANSNAQADAFAVQTPESKLFQRMFYAADGEKAAPAGQVSNALRNYAQEASKVDAAPGLGLGLAPITAKDILETTAAKVGAPAALAKSVEEAAEAAVSKSAAAGKVVDLNAVDAARKRLVTFYGDAKGHSASDARAARRILQEFDQFVLDAVDSPAYKGDPAALETLRRARAGVADYHANFSSKGKGDEVGPIVEKILGRFPGQKATPDQIAQWSYGSSAEPGGAQAVKVSQRLRDTLGPTSPEWGAYKQGLLSHLVDAPPGGAARSATQKADRIDAFLNGTKGKPLAQTVFSAEERAALARHAETLRASEPAVLKDLGTVDKVLARITGRDGGPPAALNDVTDYFFGPNSGKSSLQFQLATRLKRDLSPEGFDALRSGMWSKLTGVTEGKSDLTAKRLSDNLFEFLNGNGGQLSKVLYSPAERAEMLKLAEAVKMHIPVAGSTNPSGTAPMIAKIGAKLAHGILPMAGLVHGGLPGAIIGAVADKGVTALKNSRAAKEAGLLYYGQQPKVPLDPKIAKAAAIIARGAAQGEIGAGR